MPGGKGKRTRCEGLPGELGQDGTSCQHPESEVRISHGDIWLCKYCEDIRFPINTKQTPMKNSQENFTESMISQFEHDQTLATTGTKAIVLNEVLTFIHDKINHLTNDSVVQICTNFYDESALKDAYKKLHDVCFNEDNKSQRFRKRIGPQSKDKTVRDILDIMHAKDLSNMTFAAANLSNLPPVGTQNVDICALLRKIESNTADLQFMKLALETMQQQLMDQTSIFNSATNSLQKKCVDNELIIIKESIKEQPVSSNKNIDGMNKATHKDVPNDDIDRAGDKTYANVVSKDSFTLVENKKRNKNRVSKQALVTDDNKKSVQKTFSITGRAENATIQGRNRKRLANLFVSRLKEDTEPTELKAYLKSKLDMEVEVDCVKKTDWYASFHIKCYCDDPSVFMNPDIWPLGTFVRWWKENRNMVNHTKETK